MLNKNEYLIIKAFLIKHNVNDSVPQLIDRTNNSSIICLVDNILVDVEFNDSLKQITFHQMFELVYGDDLSLQSIDMSEHKEFYNTIKKLACGIQ